MKMNLGIVAFLFLAIGYVAGCGSGGGNNNTAVASCPANYSLVNGTCQPLTSTSLAYQGSCQVGYVQTSSYGCQPQGNCTIGQGSYNGTCVPAVVSGIGTTASCQGTCQPGYVQTLSYGCQPQGNCMATNTTTCSGSYNGGCVPGITTGTPGFPGYPGQTYPPAGYPTSYPTGYPTGYPYGTAGYPTTGYYPYGLTSYNYYPANTGFSGGFFVW